MLSLVMSLMLLLAVLLCSSLAHSAPVDDSPSDIPSIDIDPADGRLVYGLSVPIMFLSLFGCAYVFYRTFLRWSKGRGSLSMAIRVPVYIAISGVRFHSAESALC